MAVLSVSDGELRRLEVLRDVDRGGLPVRAAAQLLGRSERQVFRLLKALCCRSPCYPDPAAAHSFETHAHAREPLAEDRQCTGKDGPMGGYGVYGEEPSEIVVDFWVFVSRASLRCSRSRQAGEQKRDHLRAGRKSLSHPSQRRLSACAGASVSRPLAGGISISSTTGDETHFCLAPLPRKIPSGGSLYLTRRNGWFPSL